LNYACEARGTDVKIDSIYERIKRRLISVGFKGSIPQINDDKRAGQLFKPLGSFENVELLIATSTINIIENYNYSNISIAATMPSDTFRKLNWIRNQF